MDTEALGVHLECFLLDLSDLRRAEAELSERCQTLTEQARREAMTGLLNKDAFRLDVRTYLSAAGPEETYALLVTDLDDFKRFNDRYGHTFGDQVLLAFAAILSRSFGPGALCGRYGETSLWSFCPGPLPGPLRRPFTGSTAT
ncbi:MAG: GGDEF domain-containing protein [Intestinimonas sp.]